jgi:ribonuclease D
LLPLRDTLGERLQSLNRLEWLAAEMTSWQEEVQKSRSRQRWRKVAGTAGLSARSLAIVRELWLWRDEQARERDLPPRRVLRDDLMVEIARRQSAHVEKIRAIRGLEHLAIRRALPQLADCVRHALKTPESELPRSQGIELPTQLLVISQFLTAALNAICQKSQVATSLVGTASDVRDLVAFRLGFLTTGPEEIVSLTTGWRAEVVGSLLDDLLAGKRSVRIHDPRAPQPLAIELVPGADGE